MKRRRATTLVFAKSLSIILCALCALCALCGELSAQDFKQLYPGVEHAQVTHKIGTDPVKINLLRLDLKKVRLDVHHARDSSIGTETTSSLATRHRAIAAINAGFFKLDSTLTAGDAAGVLMIDGVLLSESQNSRAALLITNGPSATRIAFANLDIWTNLMAGPYAYPVNGIDRARKENEFVVYTPAFGRTTLTSPGGTEYIVRRGRVTKISKTASSPIPPDGFVLSAGRDWNDDPFKKLFVGRNVRLANRRGITRDADGFVAEDITNGVALLVKDGRIEVTWELEKAAKAFVENRHPRTAVAKLKDGKFLMVTVDGRQPGISVGMNLQELAEYLFNLGATDAMNLDGGGSTTMYLDGKVVNTPSDKEGERKIGDAILVTLRKMK